MNIGNVNDVRFFQAPNRNTPSVGSETLKSIFSDFVVSLRRAEAKHPCWSNDPMQQACIIAEEAGEICKAACDMVHKEQTLVEFGEEVRHTAAVCIRALAWVYEMRDKP